MRVLITGGAGFLGRALVRRCLKDGAERVVVYSRSESRQAEFQAALGPHPNIRFFLGDVRDRERLTEALYSCHAVVHAAALKRVDAMAYNPEEVRKTNIEGSANVIAAAVAAGVEGVLMVSSDKAVEPTNVYGVSKAQMEAEAITSNAMAWPRGTRIACTRWGNVLGSTGSVVNVWRQAIAERRPLRITTPRATRFWLTVEDAVDVVLAALAHMQGGEIFVPRLDAMRLDALADALAGPRYPREVVGARPGGEKTHEVLWNADESQRVVAVDHGLYAIKPALCSWRGDDPWGVPIAVDPLYRSDRARLVPRARMRAFLKGLSA